MTDQVKSPLNFYFSMLDKRLRSIKSLSEVQKYIIQDTVEFQEKGMKHYASIKTMSGNYGCSRPTVDRAIAGLKKKPFNLFINIENRPGKDGKANATNIYTVNKDLLIAFLDENSAYTIGGNDSDISENNNKMMLPQHQNDVTPQHQNDVLINNNLINNSNNLKDNITHFQESANSSFEKFLKNNFCLLGHIFDAFADHSEFNAEFRCRADDCLAVETLIEENGITAYNAREFGEWLLDNRLNKKINSSDRGFNFSLFINTDTINLEGVCKAFTNTSKPNPTEPESTEADDLNETQADVPQLEDNALGCVTALLPKPEKEMETMKNLTNQPEIEDAVITEVKPAPKKSSNLLGMRGQLRSARARVKAEPKKPVAPKTEKIAIPEKMEKTEILEPVTNEPVFEKTEKVEPITCIDWEKCVGYAVSIGMNEAEARKIVHNKGPEGLSLAMTNFLQAQQQKPAESETSSFRDDLKKAIDLEVEQRQAAAAKKAEEEKAAQVLADQVADNNFKKAVAIYGLELVEQAEEIGLTPDIMLNEKMDIDTVKSLIADEAA